jgi:hypothetical protein
MTFNSVNGNPFGNSGLNFKNDKDTAGRMQKFMGSPEFKVASAAENNNKPRFGRAPGGVFNLG